MNSRRLVVVLLVLVPALALIGCGAKDTGSTSTPLPAVREHTADEASNIVIEAEAFASIEPPMKVVEDKDASGGKCITIPGDAGKPGADIPEKPGAKYPGRWGAAVYKLDCKEPGKYRLWGRKIWAGGCGNSFTVMVNGGAPVEFGGDAVYDKWDWQPCIVFFNLKAGENTFEVLNREPGVSLDKVIFTRSTDFIPQGKE